MTFYVSPKLDRPGVSRPVISCVNMSATQAAIVELRRQGWGDEFNVTRGDVVCDFCSHPEITKLYSVAPGGLVFSVIEEDETFHHGDSDRLWGACSECFDRISADDWPGLAKRSIKNAIAQTPGLPEELLTFSVVNAHNYFRVNWDALGRPAPSDVQTDADFMRGSGIGE